MPRSRPLATPGGDSRDLQHAEGLPATATTLTATRSEIRGATEPERLVELLAQLRTLETEAEVRLLRLSVAEGLRDQSGDEVLDTKATAALIGRSVDWVNRHRHELRSALVSETGARPRYSRQRLTKLLERWGERS